MVELLLLLAVGCIVGTYAGAIGAGGGFLILPFMLWRYPEIPIEEIATATLIVVVISNGIRVLYVSRLKRVDLPLACLLVVVALPFSLLGSAMTAQLSREVFTLGFSVLLMLVGMYLVYRPKPGLVAPVSQGWRREVLDSDGATFLYHVPIRRSMVVVALTAAVSSLAGIGGGLLYSPLATRVMRVPYALAVPIAYVLTTSVAGIAVMLHLGSGHMGPALEDVPALSIGLIVSVPLAQRVQTLLGESVLTRALAVGLLIVAVRTTVLAI